MAKPAIIAPASMPVAQGMARCTSAVPMIVPGIEPVITVGEFEKSQLAGEISSALARPKSSTFTLPSDVTLILAGFRSR